VVQSKDGEAWTGRTATEKAMRAADILLMADPSELLWLERRAFFYEAIQVGLTGLLDARFENEVHFCVRGDPKWRRL
jgi:hypothetical protein